MSLHAAGRRGPPLPALRIAILFFLVTLLSISLPAVATAQDPITEITFIDGHDTPTPAGFTKINVDLNQGAGGDFIYLCYKRGVGAPITGLAVTVNSGSPPSDAEYVRWNLDLNRNAGGAYIYLWYSKDPDCSVIRDLHVQADTGPVPSGFTRINVDLNQGAGGAYIYLSYLKP